jgi:beta-xylosidase
MRLTTTRSRRAGLGRRRRLAGLLATLALLAGASLAGAVPAAASSPMFRAGEVWHGKFASPSVLKVGHTYWAYATATGGDNLPVLHSTNLKTWYVRSAYPADANPGWWSGYNDALPHPASWAYYSNWIEGHLYTEPWAPSVGYYDGRYLAAYSVPVNAKGRRCISIAVASSPQGPFVDHSRGPIVCSSDPMGSIDPQILTPGNGRLYLVWKNEGVPGHGPTRLWSRQLAAGGTSFARGSVGHQLLHTARAWEGNVIENPAMIHYAGRYYLFYSGNHWSDPSYATGYAICSGPLGPCRRPSNGRLLATGHGLVGPGGAAPFVGPAGGLRLAYHAWTAPFTSTAAPRTMRIALLAVASNGLLHLVSRG